MISRLQINWLEGISDSMIGFKDCQQFNFGFMDLHGFKSNRGNPCLSCGDDLQKSEIQSPMPFSDLTLKICPSKSSANLQSGFR